MPKSLKSIFLEKMKKRFRMNNYMDYSSTTEEQMSNSVSNGMKYVTERWTILLDWPLRTVSEGKLRSRIVL